MIAEAWLAAAAAVGIGAFTVLHEYTKARNGTIDRRSYQSEY